MDFIETVIGNPQDRNIDFLTIHPRTRSTPSTTPINLEALEILTNKYGDQLPILVSGDVFSMGSLPYKSPLPGAEGSTKPHLPKLAGLMSARALLANPALFAGYEACPWEAVELFMNKVMRAPLPFKLVQHHRTLPCPLLSPGNFPYVAGPVFLIGFVLIQNTVGEMCGPGYGPDKSSLLDKKERMEMYNCTNMCDLIDFLDEKMENRGGKTGLMRDSPQKE
jgi:tRNA-dihydrouridine synthase 4